MIAGFTSNQINKKTINILWTAAPGENPFLVPLFRGLSQHVCYSAIRQVIIDIQGTTAIFDHSFFAQRKVENAAVSQPHSHIHQRWQLRRPGITQEST